MATQLAEALERVIMTEAANLRRMDDGAAARRPTGEGSWSSKEELGHLLDSAVNNHWRFAKAAIGPTLEGPSYQQDEWVKVHGYQERRWTELVDFWEQHNRQIVLLVERIPEEHLETPCVIGGVPAVTLGFLIGDYTVHMQHHLDHLLGREKITKYPA